jgi:hypothetical protein
VCTGTLVQYEQTVRGGGGGECVRVRRYTMSKQSGTEWRQPHLSIHPHRRDQQLQQLRRRQPGAYISSPFSST